MAIFDVRDLVAFPTSGNNASDTVIGDVHFNLTTLEYWNYTLYSNGTLSNGSKCFLTFEPYTPKLLYTNGTFINATSCYSPINPLGQRSKTGIAFAVLFGLMLVFNLIVLTKHGRMFLPAEKRFFPIGRRWQWYWGSLVSVAALISLFTNIDVDRYYIVELPIVLTSFFWFLMQMCALAAVWEAARHWGSWMERQFIDPNPFVVSDNDRRATIELFMPLVFYLFWWLNFFMIVPRNWGAIELQRDADQISSRASPSATDARFKSAAFLLFAAWLVVIFSLRHTIRHYLPRNRGVFNRTLGIVRQTPFRFVLLLPLALAMIVYQALCAWDFSYSVLNVHGNRLAIYVGGYLPSLLIIFVQVIHGWLSPNEDRELIRQRRLRGEQMDRELGIVHKPAWWQRLNGDHHDGSMRAQVLRNVREIGGGSATTKNIDQSFGLRAANATETHEMANFSGSGLPPQRHNSTASIRSTASSTPSFTAYGGKSDRRRTERTMHAAASMLFPGSAPAPNRRADLMADGPPPPPYRDSTGAGAEDSVSRGRTRTPSDGQNRPGTAERSNSTGTTASITAPAQQVRSMLDV